MKNVAIFGAGRIGRIHATNLAALSGVRLRYVSDPVADAAASLAGPLGAEVAGIEQVFADPAIAVIYIASPPASHLLHVGRALDAGKAVFCEKPLATDREAAAAMVARVEREGAPAADNNSLAHSTAYLAAA